MLRDLPCSEKQSLFYAEKWSMSSSGRTGPRKGTTTVPGDWRLLLSLQLPAWQILALGRLSAQEKGSLLYLMSGPHAQLPACDLEGTIHPPTPTCWRAVCKGLW